MTFEIVHKVQCMCSNLFMYNFNLYIVYSLFVCIMQVEQFHRKKYATIIVKDIFIFPTEEKQ